MRRIGTVGTTVAVTLVLFGAPAWVGAQTRTKTTMEEAKTGLSDSWITAKTKIALYADSRVSGTQVSVDTTNGMVYLRGSVDSDAAKAAAEDVARGLDGVRGVKNELQVVPASMKNAVEAKDDDITKQVKERFASISMMKSLDVRTDNGVVTIEGKLPSITDGARASQTAREVPGVRAVRNDTTYDTPRVSMSGDRPLSGDRMTRTGRMAAKHPAGSDHVRAAQRALEDKGFSPGPIDGIWGPQTAAAVSDYQRKEGMTVSGRLDATTMSKLEMSPDGASAKKRQNP